MRIELRIEQGGTDYEAAVECDHQVTPEQGVESVTAAMRVLLTPPPRNFREGPSPLNPT